jgi:SAM-dependent methyltransferase
MTNNPPHISLNIGDREALLRRSLYSRLFEAVQIGLSASVSGARVLDVGCGRGELMSLLAEAGADVEGVDFEPACVEVSRQHGPCRVATIDELPNVYSSGSFDAIVCSHVLEHLDAPTEALRRMAALRAKHYVFAVPNVLRGIRMARTIVGSRAPDHPAHLYGWGRAEFGALLAHCGYAVTSEHTDRVTVNPMSGRLGSLLSGVLEPLEVCWLPRFFPLLSSSIIVGCQLVDAPSDYNRERPHE